MYHFEYVSKTDAMHFRKEFEAIINQVQNIVRPYFTFNYRFIGSSERNMITYDPMTNVGFDFDVNLYVNDDDQDFEPGKIREILRNAINEATRMKGFQPCEDSTRVITLKMINPLLAKVCYSCDFAIVYDYEDDFGKTEQQYIRFNKKQNTYTWEHQSKGYMLYEKVEWIKYNNLWNKVRELYLDKKNYRSDLTKKSRALYAETINEICQFYGYKTED